MTFAISSSMLGGGSVSMKFEKSPLACVSDHRIWSTCRTTTPFALGDRYDCTEACKNKFHVMGSYRKFFGGSRSRSSHLRKLSFLNWLVRVGCSRDNEFKKKHHLLAFPFMESHPSVVRPSRLLWEIDMIIRTLAKTNFMSWEATEIFLRTLKSLSSLEKTLFLKPLGRVDPYQWIQKESFLWWRQWLQGHPKFFLLLSMTWNLFLYRKPPPPPPK